MDDKQKLELLKAMVSRAEVLGHNLRTAMPRHTSYALVIFHEPEEPDEHALIVIESNAPQATAMTALRTLVENGPSTFPAPQQH
jgi:hypothetical protein